MRKDFNLSEELAKLPEKPGVYLMHDDHDEILYVGKAVRLKNRVRQYFQSSRGKTAKILKMVSQIAYFEYIVTDSEHEALILECNLIKEYRPKYNTMLVDDKGYPFMEMTVSEDYPRLLISRQRRRDQNRYFGPYTSGTSARIALDYLQKEYKLRTCAKTLSEGEIHGRACLNYQMGLCDAPCQGKISKKKYGERIENIIRFLEGDESFLVRPLEKEMKDAAAANRFEEAMQKRDLIAALHHVSEKQKMTNSDSFDDRDVIGFAKEGEDIVVSLFTMRGGQMLGRERFSMVSREGSDDNEILRAFLLQFYPTSAEIPKEILLPMEIEDIGEAENYLTVEKGRKVSILFPKRGEKAKMVSLAQKNAEMILQKDREKLKKMREQNRRATDELEALLGLSGLHRLEAYDISNISGFESVGSMVVFEDGKPKKSDYRKFRIRTVSGPNDYASMEEVLSRRFQRALKQDSRFSVLPDLILMDGGRGQVHIAEKVLTELSLSIPVAGMVKDDHHNTRGIFFRDRAVPVSRHAEAFHFITRIQDEAHRFAITFHRGLHTKGTIRSVFDEIPGVGEKRKKSLMRAFRDLEGIRQATVMEIAALDGFTKPAAENVYQFLHSTDRGVK